MLPGMSKTKDALIGDAIKRRREMLGLSQVRAAAAAEIAITTLREFETDDERPHSLATEFKLARALDWPPDAIRRLRDGENADAFTPALAAADPDGLDEVKAALDGLVDAVAVLVSRLETAETRLLQVERRLHG